MIKISYCITVADEKKEFIELIDFLNTHKRKEDNIFVLVDSNKCTDKLSEYILDLTYDNKIISTFSHFKGNFSDWKNMFWEISKEIEGEKLLDYLFFIDADELPNPELIENLPYILEINPEVDVYGVPRINYVKEITQEYIQQMGWRQDEKGRINYPDYQYRICKNSNIRWGGKIHETLTDYNLRIELPKDDVYDLLHIKTFEKQQKQNNFYNSLQ